MESFYDKVYEYLLTIPEGKVVTYGQISRALGRGSPRAVGNALHANPAPDVYPCYKVVDNKGRLAKHFAFGGEKEQKARLEKDGITVIDNKVDINKYKL